MEKKEFFKELNWCMVQQNKENHQYLMPINNDLAKVEYTIRNGIMFLVHSEIPYNYRGQGFGKILVEKLLKS